MKRPLLTVYDYGQGGAWLLIDAKSPAEIEKKYPMLKAFADRPEWMSEQEKTSYVQSCENKGFHWDIDQKPSGWLKQVAEAPS